MKNAKQPPPDRDLERSTPGRPHDSSRQQKHTNQNVESGSDSLDRRSGQGGAKQRVSIPPGAK